MSRISETDLIINPDGRVYHLNLKPEDLCKMILTVGDPGRVNKISQYFDTIDFKMEHREFVAHRGNFQGKELMVISTGMGTDNVEIFMTEIDALVNVDFSSRKIKEQKTSLNIIRVGTSGTLQPDIEVGSHLASVYGVGLDTLMMFYEFIPTAFEEEVGHKLQELADFQFTPYCVKGSESLMDQFGFDMIKANTITSPGFYAPQGRSVRLALKNANMLDQMMNFRNGDFRLTNFEMETAAYYSLGRMLGHQTLSLNAILANRPKKEFSNNPDEAVDSLIKKVLERI